MTATTNTTTPTLKSSYRDIDHVLQTWSEVHPESNTAKLQRALPTLNAEAKTIYAEEYANFSKNAQKYWNVYTACYEAGLNHPSDFEERIAENYEVSTIISSLIGDVGYTTPAIDLSSTGLE